VAHFDLLPSHKPGSDERENTPEKHLAMFTRRATNGQHFTQPYFGCREFAASYRLATEGFSPCRLPENARNRNLGWMLYDLQWPEMEAEFYPAVMLNGAINVQALRSPTK
jgi:CRISPR-associated protein Cas5d